MRSKYAAGSGSCVMSCFSTRKFGWRAAIWRGSMSVHNTEPPGAQRSAIHDATEPPPPPTSRQFQPGARPTPASALRVSASYSRASISMRCAASASELSSR